MHDGEIVSFNDTYLSQTEKLPKVNEDIFTAEECSDFRNDLLTYLLEKPDKKTAHIFLVKKDAAIVGMVMYRKVEDAQAYYKIEWLAIDPAEQGKGYGTLLMKKAFETIQEVGGQHVYVETSNERYNQKAKHFYEQLGFKKMGVLPDYYAPPKNRHKIEDYSLFYKNLTTHHASERGSVVLPVIIILCLILIVGGYFVITAIMKNTAAPVETTASAEPTTPPTDFAPEVPMSQKTTIVVRQSDSSTVTYIVPKGQVDTFVQKLPEGDIIVSKQ